MILFGWGYRTVKTMDLFAKFNATNAVMKQVGFYRN